MIRNDMKKRMELARAKIYNALELGGGHSACCFCMQQQTKA